MTRKRVISLAVLLLSLLSGWGPWAPVAMAGAPALEQDTAAWAALPYAQVTPQDLSGDQDGDGLPDSVEQGGWTNTAGTFVTNPQSTDSDSDGLSDGEEKLFNTNPLNARSPGIYVLYNNALATAKYFSWSKYGDRYIAFKSAVVRRGAVFSVGGPSSATFTIGKSKSTLTSLGKRRDTVAGRWQITIPRTGTVGQYRLTMKQGTWQKSINLYVIFELPTNMSAADVAAYVYDNSASSFRDKYAIWYMTQYDKKANSWWPDIHPTYHRTSGYAYAFQTDHLKSYVFESHVIKAINGYSSTSAAANALGRRLDSLLRFEPNTVRYNMYSTLHASNKLAQCSTHAAALASFLRGAGIPARPVVVDWDMFVVKNVLFDHSTEAWIGNRWMVMRAYARIESSSSAPIAGGIRTLRERSNWFYHDNAGDIIAVGGSNWVWNQTQTGGSTSGQMDYMFGNYLRDRIVRWSWVWTQVLPYGWKWGKEPTDIGDPYQTVIPPPQKRTAAQSSLDAVEPQTADQPSPDAVEPQVADQPLDSVKLRAEPEVRLDKVVADYGLDPDGDGRWDELVIEVEVTATRGGHYTFGALLDHPGLTEYYGSVPGLASTTAYLHVKAGTQQVRLSFSGPTLALARLDGPYQVKEVWVSALGPQADPTLQSTQVLDSKTMDYQTQAYAARAFEDLGAVLLDSYVERGLDADGDGQPDGLALEVAWEASTPGVYVVMGDLLDGQGQLVAQARWSGTQSPAVLEFGQLAGTSGPYALGNLYLLDEQEQMVDSRESAYTLKQELQPEPKTRIAAVDLDLTIMGDVEGIQSTPALPGQFTDRGEDLDGDGLFERLVIEVPVEVTEAGLYRVEGWLEGSDGVPVCWAVSDATTLDANTGTLTLAFSGPALRAHSVNGPLAFTALKLLQGEGYTVIDEVDVAYTTQSYTSEQFESEPVQQ